MVLHFPEQSHIEDTAIRARRLEVDDALLHLAGCDGPCDQGRKPCTCSRADHAWPRHPQHGFLSALGLVIALFAVGSIAVVALYGSLVAAVGREAWDWMRGVRS